MEAVLKLFVFQDIGCKLNLIKSKSYFRIMSRVAVLDCIKALQKTHYMF